MNRRVLNISAVISIMPLSLLLAGCASSNLVFDSSDLSLDLYVPPPPALVRIEIVDTTNVGMKARIVMSDDLEGPMVSQGSVLRPKFAKYRMRINDVTIARGEAQTKPAETGDLRAANPFAIEFVFIRWDDLAKVRDVIRQGNGRCSITLKGKAFFDVPDRYQGGPLVAPFDLLALDELDVRGALTNLKDKRGAAKSIAMDLGIDQPAQPTNGSMPAAS
jgi:hypothetical protein